MTPVSGIVYDPEAFNLSLFTFPGEGPDGPPPALFEGIPHLMRSAAIGARVSLTQGGTPADASGPSTPSGFWQTGAGVPSGPAVYQMRAEPPAEGLVMGAPEIFPSEIFGPIPTGKYFPTTTLRPIVPLAASCDLQVAAVVGETGALGAVANLMTDMGTPTTAEDLANPNKTGGVVLAWVASPSPVFDYFIGPAGNPWQGGIAAEASAGTLYPIQWAPPGLPPEEAPPGQSPMGYFATPGSVSMLGYFAVVLPPGATGPLTLRFIDTAEPPPDGEPQQPGPPPRPWAIPELTAEVGPGVSFARLHAGPSGPPPPEDPYAEYRPAPDMSWMCLPPPPMP
jgi:hypothetical protein